MKKKPNLLFIFSDQHAKRVTGCYADADVKTPSLDKLAESGVTFDNAYCPSPICVPSRMAMLTACHPHKQECWTNDDYLSSDIPTWLHAVSAVGYEPELIGRLHAMGPDQLHGYASRSVGEHSPNWPGVARHSMGVLEKTNDPNKESVIACGAGQSAYELKDRDVTTAAIEALHNHAAIEPEARKPFCITVGLMLPHAPYVAQKKWVDYYLERLPEPTISAPENRPSKDSPCSPEHPWITWWRTNRGIDSVDPDQAKLARAAYWGLVSTMDEMIGQILDALSATGLAENTLVVYASDHGDHVGDRGLWWKHTLYDESTCVPLIMSMPGTLTKRSRCASVVSLLDVSQTMIDALGGSPLPHADGNSFWPLLTGQSCDWGDRVFSEYCTDSVPEWTGGQAVRQRMLREGDWKLHVYHGYPPLLFNLADDPNEQINRAEDPRCAERLRQMMEVIHKEWNPDNIKQIMRRRRDRKDVIAEWSRAIEPASTHLWPLEPSMNALD
jgi:choline-sulfatase